MRGREDGRLSDLEGFEGELISECNFRSTGMDNAIRTATIKRGRLYSMLSHFRMNTLEDTHSTTRARWIPVAIGKLRLK